MTEACVTVCPSAPVVIDIGGDIGAAVVMADPSLAGHEVEIRARESQWDGRHVALHRRQTTTGQCTAAVFAGLPAGEWDVRLRDRTQAAFVGLSVQGGRVTTVNLPYGPSGEGA